MKIAHVLGLALTIGTLAGTTSGCFATRMVRTDTTTSYAIVEQAPASIAPPRPTQPQPAPGAGTLVVEALVVPPPPASSARPVRLPDAVAALSADATPSAPAPGWDPLPSYVQQFTGTGWQHRAMFGGATQSSTSFRRWGPYGSRGVVQSGYAPTPGGYGSASPHFSSPPSFSGSLSSHFAGGYPGSGY